MRLMLLAEHGHGWWVVWPILWLVVIVGVVWFLSRRWRPRNDPPAQPGA
ncbi:MAG: hypothetical protein ACRDNP_05075 [Gaiellaceae bacterium]